MRETERDWNPTHWELEDIQKGLRTLPEAFRPTVRRVDHLADIFTDPLFQSQHPPIDIWSDFDGVANSAFQKNTDPYRWFALRTLASHSKNFHFATLRYPYRETYQTDIEGYSTPPYHRSYGMPYFPDELKARITKVLTRDNANCTVEFHLGASKLFNRKSQSKFSKTIFEDLCEGTPVVLLGSGFVDRKRFKNLMKTLTSWGVTDFSLLHFFDTGRFLV